MSKRVKPPTRETYDALQRAYTAMNGRLFRNQLPGAILTLRRAGTSGRAAAGYYSPGRFGRIDGDATVDEIALEPGYFELGAMEALQTLGHEMCHQWQVHHGRPSRAGYHNREWAEMMLSVGLVPSDTGQPGGRMTGQRMADYPAPDGRFTAIAERLIRDGFAVAWFDRDRAGRGNHPPATVANDAENDDQAGTGGGPAKPRPKNKIRFTCPTCNANAWGKPSLAIACLGDIDSGRAHPPAAMSPNQ